MGTCGREKLIVIILLYLFLPVSSSLVAPELKISLGKVRGVWRTSYDGKLYAAFEGIPYAKPPVSSLRFEEPQAVSPWSDVLIAKKLYTCIQFFRQKVVGKEDCLYVNVYVPGDFMSHKKVYPVVVIIHGGTFMMGSGHMMTNSKYFMDREMIVVTFNYRLGAFGFLSTEDDAIPGNNGLKDQVLALKWVKLNVASFGGNPNSITLAGYSAGGASAHLHYFSHLSKGLFAKGMSQSGTALDPWVVRRNPLENAKKLAALLGCKTKSSKDIKKCLKNKSATTIAGYMKYFYGYGQMPFAPFGPVLEKKSKHPFLTKNPFSMLKQKEVLDLPWITSTCAQDGLLPAADYYAKLEKLDKMWGNVAQYVLDYNYTVPVSKRQYTAGQIKEFYLGQEKFSKNVFDNVVMMFTDRLFAVGAETAVKLQSIANKSPVYYYLFNYGMGENNIARNNSLGGVGHYEDAIYFYGAFIFRKLSEEDQKIRNICLNILHTYAKSGKPTCGKTGKRLLWKPSKGSAQLIYLNITSSDSLDLITTASLVPADFWSRLGLLDNESFTVKDEL